MWRTLVETPAHVLRVISAPPASLLVTHPAAMTRSLADLLGAACARFAPQVVFGHPTWRPGHMLASTRLGEERIEVGVVARLRVAVSYFLASKPDGVPDIADLLDDILARARGAARRIA